MAIKIFAIGLLLFILEIAYLSTHEPITLEIKKQNMDFSDITFENINAYVLTTEGIKTTLEASKALSYKDKNMLYNIKSHLIFDKRADTIIADEALHQNNTLYLKNNVVYESNNSTLLKSDDLVYNINKGIAISNAPFIMKQTNIDAKGSYFVYNTKEQYIKAKNIVINIEEK